MTTIWECPVCDDQKIIPLQAQYDETCECGVWVSVRATDLECKACGKGDVYRVKTQGPRKTVEYICDHCGDAI